jgi:hypothetical protein
VWTNSTYCVVEYRLATAVTAFDRLPLHAEDLGAMKDVQLVRGTGKGIRTPDYPPRHMNPDPETSVDSRLSKSRKT